MLLQSLSVRSSDLIKSNVVLVWCELPNMTNDYPCLSRWSSWVMNIVFIAMIWTLNNSHYSGRTVTKEKKSKENMASLKCNILVYFLPWRASFTENLPPCVAWEGDAWQKRPALWKKYDISCCIMTCTCSHYPQNVFIFTENMVIVPYSPDLAPLWLFLDSQIEIEAHCFDTVSDFHTQLHVGWQAFKKRTLSVLLRQA